MRTWRVYHWSYKNGEPTQLDTITVDDTYTPDQFRKDCENEGNYMCNNGDILFEDVEGNLMWIEGNKEPVNIF